MDQEYAVVAVLCAVLGLLALVLVVKANRRRAVPPAPKSKSSPLRQAFAAIRDDADDRAATMVAEKLASKQAEKIVAEFAALGTPAPPEVPKP